VIQVDPDGQDHFDEYTLSVTVADGRLTLVPAEGASNAKLCFIEISGDGTPVNTAPVADDQSVTTDEDTTVAITLSATDADGDALSYSVVSAPASGTLSGTAPNLTYTPDAGFVGSDSFTFVANDGTVDSNTATVSITVNEVAQPQTVRYEAEDGALNSVAVATNHAGYSGSGFVDYLHATGDYVEWTVSSASAGDAQIVFGYALGSSDRPLEIQVNGTVVASSLSFPDTGSWTNWGTTAALTVPLNAGTNTIRATAIGSSGANVDYLEVTTGQ